MLFLRRGLSALGSNSKGWCGSSQRKVAPIAKRTSLATRATFSTSSFKDNSNNDVLLGCVSYDPAVGTIWDQMKDYLVKEGGVPTFDYCLFTNYEQQVRALLQGHVDIAWNGPLAHVMCETLVPDNDGIVSLGMRDTDCGFESIIVTRKNVTSLDNTRLLAGAQDSPQAFVVPQFVVQNIAKINGCQIIPNNQDLGKHGDTALGEIRAMEQLVSDASKEQYDGALLSRMMWDRALAGQLETVNAQTLQENFQVYTGNPEMPPQITFDHCQFDALASNHQKVEPFYTAIHAMDFDDPFQQNIMKLEGIKKTWAKPRQEGYDIVRQAMRSPGSDFSSIMEAGLAGRTAQNFVPSSGGTKRAFSSFAARRSLKGQHDTKPCFRAMTTATNNPSSHNTTTASLKPGKSRIGVIGCGVAGLQVIRSMRARGFDVTAFDKASDIGGLWRENYDGFSLQVGKQFFELPDLEMTEAEWQELASGPQVQTYIQRFAKHFDLMEHVQLDTGIDRVTRNDNDGTWTFRTQEGKEHVFDYCVVATGMYSSIPFVPTVKGKDAFGGSVIHSSQFFDAQAAAENKRVVVVGGGKSATDCSTSAAKAGAASVTMVQRNAHWPTPLYIAGLIPFQHVFLSRLGQALVEAKVGVYPSSSSAASMFRPLMGPIFAIVEELFAFQLGLRGNLRPKAGVVEDFYGYAAVQDGSFKSVRDSGKVQVQNGEIDTFTKDGVRVNDQDIASDIVIFATGFGKDYSRLFEPDVIERLDVQKDGLYLYKRILPPSVPGLAFVGSECATIFNCTNSGLQAEWLARLLAGETMQGLSEEDMKSEARAFREFARSWMPETASRSALVLLHQLHYYDQLLEDMGENPSRKSNPVAEYLGSYYSRDYNNIVGRTVASLDPHEFGASAIR